MNSLYLLLQIILLLNFAYLLLYPAANFFLNFKDFHLLTENAIKMLQPCLHIDTLQNSLPILQLKIEVASNQISHASGISYYRYRNKSVRRNLLADLYPVFKLAYNSPCQGLHFHRFIYFIYVLFDFNLNI